MGVQVRKQFALRMGIKKLVCYMHGFVSKKAVCYGNGQVSQKAVCDEHGRVSKKIAYYGQIRKSCSIRTVSQ